MNLGTHFLVEFGECDPARLNDLAALKAQLAEAALASGATIVGEASHAFHPQGVTAILLLAESHVSLHTWPELSAAALDFFSCSSAMKVERAIEILERAVGAKTKQIRVISRALASNPTA